MWYKAGKYNWIHGQLWAMAVSVEDNIKADGKIKESQGCVLERRKTENWTEFSKSN